MVNRRGKIVKKTPVSRICIDCHEEKPISEYGVSSRVTNTFSPRCKDCQRSKMYEAKYGITYREYLARIEQAGRKCEICGKEKAKRKNGVVDLCLDHDHATGLPRGFLCNACNTAIGMMEDDENILKSAIAYLRKYSK